MPRMRITIMYLGSWGLGGALGSGWRETQGGSAKRTGVKEKMCGSDGFVPARRRKNGLPVMARAHDCFAVSGKASATRTEEGRRCG